MAEGSSKTITYAVILIIGILIGAGVGYAALPSILPQPTAQKTIKAGFIYVGPIGDIGWTYAHDYARRIVDNQFDWLETGYAESVPEGEAMSYIENFINNGYDVIFTTSFGYMDQTLEAAQQYPDKIFFHCSGYKRYKNMGTYFAEFYQLYYLNGIMAGALTKTNHIGYVAAHLIPEVVRHINAFTLGARAVNPNVTVYIRVLNAWYDPAKARDAAASLIDQDNVDVIAFTEDSAAIPEYAESLYQDQGKQIYVFGHYSPMLSHGPDVVVSGQIVHWEVIYADILSKIYAGMYNTTNLENVDYWWMLKEGAVELGADFGVPINPKFKSELQSKMVTDPVTGKQISAYDLVFELLSMMSEETVLFDPYTGPIYFQNGTLWLPEGVRASHDQLWSINFYVEGVDPNAPKP
ncbi:MAG: BMP family ABC transporter substrate-binding protein [Candidatus Asgardarchaeia archaeon]